MGIIGHLRSNFRPLSAHSTPVTDDPTGEPARSKIPKHWQAALTTGAVGALTLTEGAFFAAGFHPELIHNTLFEVAVDTAYASLVPFTVISGWVNRHFAKIDSDPVMGHPQPEPQVNAAE